MKALRFSRDIPRYAAARIAGTVVPGRGAAVGPLKLKDLDPPELPGPDWVRVRPRLAGICGSDLATVDGRASGYFEPIVSFPFVPGHEVVGDLDDGARVVVEPVLGCATRGIVPPCAACARGDLGGCERITLGDLAPGLQSGYCCDTGGGWSVAMVAHPTQLHPVADDLSDEAAVMIEPTACAVHAALAARIEPGAVVAVLGAGTLGLLTLAAVRHHADPATVLVAARYPVQRELARELGADVVVDPGEWRRGVRRATNSLAIGDGHIDRLTGGADVVIDCVGSEASLADSLAVVRPRGRVVLVGMPGTVNVDLTGLWHREIELVGAYAYGTEHLPDRGPVRTFDLAAELVRHADLGRLVSATYPLDRHREAIEHAAAAGPRGAVKIAFDLRNEKERDRL
ncbi:MAG TPA: zinc-binding dehydrogenase [Acidimicrobiales bacterium]|nr:zinc-binding dehydrogenase [Acidimicrobiales bacterium]